MKHKWTITFSTGEIKEYAADHLTIQSGVITLFKDSQDRQHPRRIQIVLEAFAPEEWKHCKLIA